MANDYKPNPLSEKFFAEEKAKLDAFKKKDEVDMKRPYQSWYYPSADKR